MRGRPGRPSARYVAALLLAASSAAAAGQACAHKDDPQFYFQQKYSVSSVAVGSPLSFIPAIKSREKRAEAQLPLRPGSSFTPAGYSEGVSFLREFFTLQGGNSPLAVRVVLAELRQCDDAARTLEVSYYVILSNPAGYLESPAEAQRAAADHPVTTQAETSGVGKVEPSLTAAYDPQWKLAGGAGLVVRNVASLRLAASVMESIRAHQENARISGAGTGSHGWLRSWNYQLAFHREDVPTGSGRIKTARLALGGAAATVETGPLHLSARYGVALEGGNDQSSGLAVSAAANTAASAGHGALKSQAGLSIYGGRYAAALSYGIEAASAGASTSINYVKHLADLTFVGRVPGGDRPSGLHTFTTVETEMAGGAMQQSGPMAVAERFFGGGQTPSWTTGGSWTLRAGPLFRGIPGYGLNGAGPQGSALGGRAFWSFNATVSKPVAGRPLLPEDVLGDPQLQQQIAFGLNSSEQALANSYEQKLPAMKRLIADLSKLTSPLDRLNATLNAMAAGAAQPVSDAIDATRGWVRGIQRAARAGQPLAVLNIWVPQLLGALDSLASAAGGNDAATVKSQRAGLAQLQTELQAELAGVDVASADRRAKRDLSSARSAIDILLHELNLVSVAPVGIFDAARLWPDPVRTRYAAGGGLRFSVVTLNLTAGYAVNLRRGVGEGRGAWFFSMDVSDIFK